jgi:hypothetical protein
MRRICPLVRPTIAVAMALLLMAAAWIVWENPNLENGKTGMDVILKPLLTDVVAAQLLFQFSWLTPHSPCSKKLSESAKPVSGKTPRNPPEVRKSEIRNPAIPLSPISHRATESTEAFANFACFVVCLPSRILSRGSI